MNHTAPSVEHLSAWVAKAQELEKLEQRSKGSSAVLIPVIMKEDGYHILYEVRAAKLRTQPGEICFPGGRIEPGEDPGEAAVREAMEELLIRRDQIEVVAQLNKNPGPGSIALYSYIGILHGYEGTWSRAEVEYVFTLPLDWILTHDPKIYQIELTRNIPEDFPFDKVPYGKDYHWRSEYHQIPFYPELQSAPDQTGGPRTERGGMGPEGSGGQKGPAEPISEGETIPADLPVLWGATARVTYALAELLKKVPFKDL